MEYLYDIEVSSRCYNYSLVAISDPKTCGSRFEDDDECLKAGSHFNPGWWSDDRDTRGNSWMVEWMR